MKFREVCIGLAASGAVVAGCSSDSEVMRSQAECAVVNVYGGLTEITCEAIDFTVHDIYVSQKTGIPIVIEVGRNVCRLVGFGSESTRLGPDTHLMVDCPGEDVMYF